MQKANFFTTTLLHWHHHQNKRDLPWKKEKEPYRIWLSEIMLQQTQAQNVIPYYYKFLIKYPTLKHLANAKEKQLFKLWEGLGYYQRCKNLLFTAQYIQQEYAGIFPNTYKNILALKGIGTYTAAAISSFAFNLPFAVLDGNVYRVLARFFGINIPIDDKQGKIFFEKLSQQLLDKKDPASYNQAIMDFGATICKPKQMRCDSCPLILRCVAYKKKLTLTLPIKTRSLKIKHRKIYYIIFKTDNNILLWQRTKKDIWRNLFEFYEYTQPLNIIKKFIATHCQNTTLTKIKKQYTQQLTHRHIKAHFYIANITQNEAQYFIEQGAQQVSLKNLKQFAFPKLINDFLKVL